MNAQPNNEPRKNPSEVFMPEWVAKNAEDLLNEVSNLTFRILQKDVPNVPNNAFSHEVLMACERLKATLDQVSQYRSRVSPGQKEIVEGLYQRIHRSYGIINAARG